MGWGVGRQLRWHWGVGNECKWPKKSRERRLMTRGRRAWAMALRNTAQLGNWRKTARFSFTLQGVGETKAVWPCRATGLFGRDAWQEHAHQVVVAARYALGCAHSSRGVGSGLQAARWSRAVRLVDAVEP